jgi:hypothetical protein
MWKEHLWNLLSRSWGNLLSGLSTSTLAVVIFSFAVPALIFAVVFSYKIVQGRKQGGEARNALKATAIPSLIAAILTMVVWICLFGWSVAGTVYRDHRYLVSYIPRAKQGQSILDQKVIDAQKQEIKELRTLIPKFNPQCQMQSIPLPRPKTPAAAESASEAVIVCNTELKAPTTIEIFYDRQPSGFYFPVVAPDIEGSWGFTVFGKKSLSGLVPICETNG